MFFTSDSASNTCFLFHPSSESVSLPQTPGEEFSTGNSLLFSRVPLVINGTKVLSLSAEMEFGFKPREDEIEKERVKVHNNNIFLAPKINPTQFDRRAAEPLSPRGVGFVFLAFGSVFFFSFFVVVLLGIG